MDMVVIDAPIARSQFLTLDGTGGNVNGGDGACDNAYG